MAEYEGIISRLEQATGPDRELDGRVWCAVNGYEFVQWDGAGCVYKDPSVKWDAGIRHADESRIQSTSASLDAAIALVERTLWGWLIGVTQHVDRTWQADLLPSNGNLARNVCASGLPSAPIALLLSLFRALQAKEGKDGE